MLDLKASMEEISRNVCALVGHRVQGIPLSKGTLTCCAACGATLTEIRGDVPPGIKIAEPPPPPTPIAEPTPPTAG
jgi:hypothetical protein